MSLYSDEVQINRELRKEVERLRAAHDYQRDMAGLMLREAHRQGAQFDELRRKVKYLYLRIRPGSEAAPWVYESLAEIAGEEV